MSHHLGYTMYSWLYSESKKKNKSPSITTDVWPNVTSTVSNCSSDAIMHVTHTRITQSPFIAADAVIGHCGECVVSEQRAAEKSVFVLLSFDKQKEKTHIFKASDWHRCQDFR